MCGIAGFIDFSKITSEETLRGMVGSMNHRGPNDSGTEIIQEENYFLGFGQARLSIIDLSADGHQPMKYKQYIIVFNGEIYNYKEIRKEVEILGHVFSTQTDTEVILQSFEAWGIHCVHKFIGMFAFTIYNQETKEFYIFRDRVGVKPLYYYKKNGLFLFGSELKALMSHPRFEKEIDKSVLPDYFQYGYIAAPNSIFSKTKKLIPGHYLSFNFKNQNFNIEPYWSLNDYYEKPKLIIDYEEAKQEIKQLMHSALNYRMVADVPVGVFLSGGYDSTAVTSIIQAGSNRPLKTFTIGFEEGNNEAPFAKATAQYLGTDHTEYICTTQEAQEIIPTLPFFFDEPFGDSSAIPTILVSKLAIKDVTVALSADGGDEIFSGYTHYQKFVKYLNHASKLPNGFGFIEKFLNYLYNKAPGKYSHHVLAALISSNLDKNSKSQYLYQSMIKKPHGYINKIFSSKICTVDSKLIFNIDKYSSPVEVAMFIDYYSYLPNDILTKVDRATMSVSLEGREPLLDHRLAEFVAQLPVEFKLDDSVSKKILKDIVHDLVPEQLMNRPKTGFTLPIYAWLRGDLSYLIDDFLSKEALSISGLFDVDFLVKEIDRFKRNKLHYSPIIWYLLMFQMWYYKWIK
jgi:asparagine synthase (glutamine-hydrolysing)